MSWLPVIHIDIFHVNSNKCLHIFLVSEVIRIFFRSSPPQVFSPKSSDDYVPPRKMSRLAGSILPLATPPPVIMKEAQPPARPWPVFSKTPDAIR